jgi:hypothetical protein
MRRGSYSRKGHSKDCPDQRHNCYRERWASDPQTQPFRHCTACFWSWRLWESVSKTMESSYSILVQSESAGHNKAPVRSWWNPRSVLTLCANRGFKDWPGGVIQSSTAPFKLFVSLDLVQDVPFWIWGNGIAHMVIIGSEETRTSSAICLIFSSEPSSRHSSSPGTIWSRSLNILCSLRSLIFTMELLNFQWRPPKVTLTHD